MNALSPSIGHQQQRTDRWLRVCSYRKSCVDCSVQGAFKGTGSHGLYCFGLLHALSAPVICTPTMTSSTDTLLQLYNDKTQVAPSLSKALNRIGHHFRESIVQQARASLGEMEDVPQPAGLGVPEPIPETQEEINKQADAAIRDLFPRIPNTDRQTIIEHSFRKVNPSPTPHAPRVK